VPEDEDASARGAVLAGILAQVSREALQGEDLDAVRQRIVACLSGAVGRGRRSRAVRGQGRRTQSRGQRRHADAECVPHQGR
jgi:hypothetical protein